MPWRPKSCSAETFDSFFCSRISFTERTRIQYALVCITIHLPAHFMSSNRLLLSRYLRKRRRVKDKRAQKKANRRDRDEVSSTIQI